MGFQQGWKKLYGISVGLAAFANNGAPTTINSQFLYGAKTWLHTYVIMAVQIRASA